MAGNPEKLAGWTFGVANEELFYMAAGVKVAFPKTFRDKLDPVITRTIRRQSKDGRMVVSEGGRDDTAYGVLLLQLYASSLELPF